MSKIDLSEITLCILLIASMLCVVSLFATIALRNYAPYSMCQQLIKQTSSAPSSCFK